MKISLTKKEVHYLKEMVGHDETIRLENLQGEAHNEYTDHDHGEADKKEDIEYATLAGSILRKLK